MSPSSSFRSALRDGGLPGVPRINCPECGKNVKMYTSNTDEHEGWVFYRCVNEQSTCDFWHWEREYVAYLVDHHVLVGDDAVEAIGASEDRREELEEARRRKMANRMQADRPGREVQGRGRQADRAQVMTKQEARALLAVGRELLQVLKMTMAALLVLCAMTVVCVLKK
ncbi:unnamed protein product [Alopecurus aequalis]